MKEREARPEVEAMNAVFIYTTRVTVRKVVQTLDSRGGRRS